jgi:hypothetical protein
MISFYRLFVLSGMLGLAFLIAPSDVWSQDDSGLPPPKFSIDARGPVHEAFAQPNEVKPELGSAIPKEPPPMLPEQPPEQRPDNPNMEWIPGYWSWDAERNNFIWVSGTFRAPPPGRRWLPGHWANTSEGWRWAAGFWADENQNELRYTPEPPASLENGPSTPPPDDNSTYIPGFWYYNQAEQRFVWRPGYWAPFRQNQVWNNPQYHWTPGGYAYTDGYWDYPLDDRGILFAPAYFPTPLWNTPGWFYRPSYVVPIGLFFNSGFYRPGYNHFYYGNYYGNNYAGLGYRPWWGGAYNPAYNYYAWQHRANPQVIAQQKQLFANRMAGKAALPPSTVSQGSLVANPNNLGNAPAVTPLKNFTPTNGKMVANNQIAAQNLQIRQSQDLAKIRANAERPLTKTNSAAPNALAASAAVKLPPALPRIGPGGASAPTSFNFKGSPFNGANGGNKGPAVGAVVRPGTANPGALNAAPKFNSVPSPVIVNRPPANNSVPKVNSIPSPTIVNRPPVNPSINVGPKANPLPNVAIQPRTNSIATPPPVLQQPRIPSAPPPRIVQPAAPTIRAPQVAPSAPRMGPSPAPQIRSMPAPSAPRSFSPPAMSRPSMGMGGMGGAPRMGGGGGAPRGGGGGGRK